MSIDRGLQVPSVAQGRHAQATSDELSRDERVAGGDQVVKREQHRQLAPRVGGRRDWKPVHLEALEPLDPMPGHAGRSRTTPVCRRHVQGPSHFEFSRQWNLVELGRRRMAEHLGRAHSRSICATETAQLGEIDTDAANTEERTVDIAAAQSARTEPECALSGHRECSPLQAWRKGCSALHSLSLPM
ncbi:hypothetical protein LQ757_16475 [Agromyces sp. SYSU K20354]|uniref:hypothetical protein n=1 Tax=Agromyces cavernae TaxID=2898659 RepID=UPI001E2F15F9|nr:hypothetical protein [Agromyces cavernae]MCD2443878.1 hypothetical protein [Agromyces cavernae]